MLRFIALAFLALALMGPCRAAPVTGAAVIVSIDGTGQYRPDARSAWRKASIGQSLPEGAWVRTGKYSRMALLAADRTQVRLNQDTVLEIKNVPPAQSAPQRRRLTAGQARFRQLLGESWVQTKTIPREMHWETPTAVAGIRGTEWQVQVFKDGRSLLTVINGEVEYANDRGSVLVGPSEQALAAAGQVPVKQMVHNPRDRIQWVTAYTVEPLRHVILDGGSLRAARERLTGTGGEDPVARGDALADLGRWREAAEAFAAAHRARPEDDAAKLGLAYVALHDRDLAGARRWLGETTGDSELRAYAQASLKVLEQDIQGALKGLEAMTGRADLDQPAPYLLLSDLMIYEGHLDRARDEVTKGFARFPDHPRLHAQLARIDLLQDRPAAALADARAALKADPESYAGTLVRADIARLEGDSAHTFADYDRAIALKPHDDRAWFGRGVAHTEREYVREARRDLERALGLDPEGPGYAGELGTVDTFADDFPGAEQAFHKALKTNPADYVALTGLGLMELKRGDTQQALDDFLKAGVMEPRYARVHVYTAVAYYQLGYRRQALEELARASQLDDKDPLPYFMASIIQDDLLRPEEAIASARKALARMPYLKSLNQLANDERGTANLGAAFASFGMEEWARSYAKASYDPFFAASHLFMADRYQGLYTKNSELFQGLIADPTVFGASNRYESLIPAPTTNGSLSWRYTKSDTMHGNSPQVETSGYRVGPVPWAWYLGYEGVGLDYDSGPYRLGTYTAAIGAKPRYDTGVFLFLDHSRLNNRIAGNSGGAAVDLNDKLGTDRADLGLHYAFNPQSQVWFKASNFSSSDDVTGTAGDAPIVSDVAVDEPEVSFRHTLGLNGGHQLSWGVDAASRHTGSTFDDMTLAPALISRNAYDFHERSTDLYLSDTWRANSDLTLQGDLVYQHHRRQARYDDLLVFPDAPPPLSVNSSTQTFNTGQINPRLGAVYRLGSDRFLRFAYQQWVRPAGFSSLGPVATAGIPLDDRLVMRGGKLQRYRLQVDWELNPHSYATAYLDNQHIDNHMFTYSPFTVNELESLNKLRPRDFGSLMRDDMLEFVNTPEYQGGHIRSAGGALDHVLSRHWSVTTRYIYADTDNTGDAYPGNRVPYVPRHTAALGATRVSPSGWYWDGLLVWRSTRYRDEANTVKLEPGWSGAFDLYRQLANKHWLLRLSADNLLDRNQDTQYTAEVNYRF